MQGDAEGTGDITIGGAGGEPTSDLSLACSEVVPPRWIVRN
jgi:hypothetical protein